MKSVEAQISKIMTNVSGEVTKAEVMAMNKAAETAMRRVIDYIRKDYNLKKKYLRKSTSKRNAPISIRKARISKPYVELMVSHIPIGLFYFGARQTKRQGVKATIRKGDRRAYEKSFIWKGKVMHRTGVKRVMTKGRYKGKVREAIEKLYGPSAEQLFSSDESMQEATRVLYVEFEKQFAVAFNYLMTK